MIRIIRLAESRERGVQMLGFEDFFAKNIFWIAYCIS